MSAEVAERQQRKGGSENENGSEREFSLVFIVLGGGGVAVETLFIQCYATTGYVSGKRANVRKSPSKSVIFADCIERDMGSVRVGHAAVVPFVVGVRRTLAALNTTCPFLISGWICFFFSLIDVVGIKSTAIVFVRSLKKC